MYHGEGKSLNRMNMQYKGEERLYAGGVGGGADQAPRQGPEGERGPAVEGPAPARQTPTATPIQKKET